MAKRKIIYDENGQEQDNPYSPNHRIASHFFGFVVDQACGYLLGNGVTFAKPETKARLGADFDEKMFGAAAFAQIGGVSFGFWNFDHVEVFKYAEFVPLYHEETGELMAGIRFWRVGDVGDDRPERVTLFEADGKTEYIKRKNEPLEVLEEKTAYITTRSSEGAQVIGGRNYKRLPIFPMKNSDDELSEIVGKQETIDALDVAASKMVDDTDEGTVTYWVIKNYTGMDEKEDSMFLRKIHSMRVIHVDGDSSTGAEPKSVEAPYAGTSATIDMLTRRLYTDFQAFDASAVSAGNQTATAINACYVPLDLKADKFEMQITRFIRGLLDIAEIDDEPTYTRNRIINKTEEIQTIMTAAPYLDEEYLTKKILTILGDADQFDEVMDRRARDGMNAIE